jgi:NAD(P)-dependent dehydrogenase (short-subunit alcohol dehydrogenase family)
MTGRRVLVTGGSSGIGAELVRRLLAEGDHVTVLDRTASDERGVASVVGDVRRADDQVRAVAEAAPEGRLDLLVANAGVHDGGRRLTDGGIEEFVQAFRHVIEVDVVGYALSLKAAAEALTAARGCALLTLSDASFDVQGNGSGTAYVAAKHAGLGLVRAAARDLAPHVRVNAVAPGGVATGLSAEDGTTSRRVVADAKDLDRRLAARTLAGRGARLDEVAAAFLYLASEQAASVTGQVLRVDGGLLS